MHQRARVPSLCTKGTGAGGTGEEARVPSLCMKGTGAGGTGEEARGPHAGFSDRPPCPQPAPLLGGDRSWQPPPREEVWPPSGKTPSLEEVSALHPEPNGLDQLCLTRGLAQICRPTRRPSEEAGDLRASSTSAGLCQSQAGHQEPPARTGTTVLPRDPPGKHLFTDKDFFFFPREKESIQQNSFPKPMTPMTRVILPSLLTPAGKGQITQSLPAPPERTACHSPQKHVFRSTPKPERHQCPLRVGHCTWP